MDCRLAAGEPSSWRYCLQKRVHSLRACVHMCTALAGPCPVLFIQLPDCAHEPEPGEEPEGFCWRVGHLSGPSVALVDPWCVGEIRNPQDSHNLLRPAVQPAQSRSGGEKVWVRREEKAQPPRGADRATQPQGDQGQGGKEGIGSPGTGALSLGRGDRRLVR